MTDLNRVKNPGNTQFASSARRARAKRAFEVWRDRLGALREQGLSVDPSLYGRTVVRYTLARKRRRVARGWQ